MNKNRINPAWLPGILLIISLVLACVPLAAQQKPAEPRYASDPQFKVKLDFNRWHDCAEIKADLLRLEKAWPKFLKYSSVGKSYDGKDMMLMTINNPDGTSGARSRTW